MEILLFLGGGIESINAWILYSTNLMLSSTPFSLNYSASTRCIVIFTKKKKKKKKIKSATWQAWALWKEANTSVILSSKKFSRYLQCYLLYLSPFYLLPYSYFSVISGWLAKSNSSVPQQWTLASYPRKWFPSQEVTYFCILISCTSWKQPLLLSRYCN